MAIILPIYKRMKVILLKGPGSCGKTTTLNLTYDILISQGAISTQKKQEGGNPQDFSDLLVLKNGQRIGFLTMGDYAYRVIELMDYFENQGCDTFVTACNEKFKKPFYHLAYYPNHQIITKVKQATLSVQNADNQLCSKTLYNLI